jgi:hypothetical protein
LCACTVEVPAAPGASRRRRGLVCQGTRRQLKVMAAGRIRCVAVALLFTAGLVAGGETAEASSCPTGTKFSMYTGGTYGGQVVTATGCVAGGSKSRTSSVRGFSVDHVGGDSYCAVVESRFRYPYRLPVVKRSWNCNRGTMSFTTSHTVPQTLWDNGVRISSVSARACLIKQGSLIASSCSGWHAVA